MDLFDLIFNTSLQYAFGVRIISLIHYLTIFSISIYYFRKAGYRFRTQFFMSIFFLIFVVMISDWSWTLAQHIRWRGYIPPTGETPWIAFQPTPFGSDFSHDWHRWILYVLGFAFSLDSLWPYFKSKLLTLNRFVYLALINYLAFWIILVLAAPNPLYCDMGLWNLWPKLALETGSSVYGMTTFLADVYSRFFLVVPMAWSWFQK